MNRRHLLALAALCTGLLAAPALGRPTASWN